MHENSLSRTEGPGHRVAPDFPGVFAFCSLFLSSVIAHLLDCPKALIWGRATCLSLLLQRKELVDFEWVEPRSKMKLYECARHLAEVVVPVFATKTTQQQKQTQKCQRKAQTPTKYTTRTLADDLAQLQGNHVSTLGLQNLASIRLGDDPMSVLANRGAHWHQYYAQEVPTVPHVQVVVLASGFVCLRDCCCVHRCAFYVCRTLVAAVVLRFADQSCRL